MSDAIARLSHPIEVHLLYATIVWIAAWFLTSLPHGSATTKYWIWVATSLNFILPFNALPSRLWPAPLFWLAPHGAPRFIADDESSGIGVIAVVWMLWAVGAVAMVVRLCLRLRADSREARATTPATRDARPAQSTEGIPVRFTEDLRGPAVDGLLRPHILLPRGIERLLTRGELDAVIVHELRHARRHDNLIRLFHEVTLCALWFHPFVWITGSRLALYRELSCDESVARRGNVRDLVTALAKLANPGSPMLLESSASSFMSHRLARLKGRGSMRPARSVNAMVALTFVAILIAAVIGPVAGAAANYACTQAHAAAVTVTVKGAAPRSGIANSVRGGIRGGIHGGVAGGIRGGIAGGVSGGIAGGVRGGISDGVSGGVAAVNRAPL